MKRVFVLLSDFTAVGLHRTILPCRYLYDELKEEGIELCMSADLRRWEEYDALMIARLLNMKFLPDLYSYKRQGTRIGWEVDDAYDLIPRWSPAYVMVIENPDSLIVAEEAANVVCCSTGRLKAHLLTRVPGKSVHVCPNLMDLTAWPAELPPRQQRGPVRVMFTGSATHEKDLELLIEPMKRLVPEYGDRVEWTFWGYCHPELIRLFYPDRLRLLPPVELHRHPQTLVQLRPDIGLCPLQNDPFSACKSNLKWLEYSMAGAATVASNFGPYADTVDSGMDGVLVHDTPDFWCCALKNLIEDAEKRHAVAAAARERTIGTFSWQRGMIHRGKWKRFFKELVRV